MQCDATSRLLLFWSLRSLRDQLFQPLDCAPLRLVRLLEKDLQSLFSQLSGSGFVRCDVRGQRSGERTRSPPTSESQPLSTGVTSMRSIAGLRSCPISRRCTFAAFLAANRDLACETVVSLRVSADRATVSIAYVVFAAARRCSFDRNVNQGISLSILCQPSRLNERESTDDTPL